MHVGLYNKGVRPDLWVAVSITWSFQWIHTCHAFIFSFVYTIAVPIWVRNAGIVTKVLTFDVKILCVVLILCYLNVLHRNKADRKMYVFKMLNSRLVVFILNALIIGYKTLNILSNNVKHVISFVVLSHSYNRVCTRICYRV